MSIIILRRPCKKKDHPTRRKMQLPTVCFSTSWITTSPRHACISPTGPPGRELATHRRMTAISAMLRRPALVLWRRCCPRCCRVPTLGTWPLFWGSLGWKGVDMLFYFLAFCFTLYRFRFIGLLLLILVVKGGSFWWFLWVQDDLNNLWFCHFPK